MESTISEVIPSNHPVDSDPLTKAIQNALILGEISKYISTMDMINCRSANHLWKNEWTPVVQKRSKFQFHLTDKISLLVKDLKVGLKESQNSDWKDIARIYFESMDESRKDSSVAWIIQWFNENIHNFPCSKFVIGTQVLGLLNKCEQFNLFRVLSSFVTQLVLETHDPDPPFCAENLKELEQEFCSLKTLELRVFTIGDMHLCMAFGFLQKIVRLAPNLDTLRLVNCYACNDEFISGCTSVISNAKEIKSLFVKTNFTDSHFNMLTETTLRLKELELVFRPLSSLSSEAFNIFLSSQSNSLKRLCLSTLKSKSFKSELRISFPRMTTLEMLEIDVNGMELPELSLHQSFPSLKQLKVLGQGVYEEKIVFNSDMHPVQTVEKLEFGLRHASQNTVLEACRIFPNLRKISIPCSYNNMLALNTGSMKSLEEATLCVDRKYHEDMIKVLTGMTKTELEAAEQSGILVETGTGPLEFLQKVKILRLENGALTDLLCILGPMKLKNLKCLDLQVNISEMKHQISQTMLEKMKENFTVIG